MGYFARKREQRQMKNAIMKAAEKQAVLDSKALDRRERSNDRFMRNTAKKVDRLARHDKKALDKENYRLAQQAVSHLGRASFSPVKALQWLAVARAVVPLAMPVVYGLLNLSGNAGTSVKPKNHDATAHSEQ